MVRVKCLDKCSREQSTFVISQGAQAQKNGAPPCVVRYLVDSHQICALKSETRSALGPNELKLES